MIQHLKCVREGNWFSINHRSFWPGLALIAEGAEFNIVEFVGALMFDATLEDIEVVIEIEDAEFVAFGNEGSKRAGFACAGVADYQTLGKIIALVLC